MLRSSISLASVQFRHASKEDQKRSISQHSSNLTSKNFDLEFKISIDARPRSNVHLEIFTTSRNSLRRLKRQSPRSTSVETVERETSSRNSSRSSPENSSFEECTIYRSLEWMAQQMDLTLESLSTNDAGQTSQKQLRSFQKSWKASSPDQRECRSRYCRSIWRT